MNDRFLPLTRRGLRSFRSGIGLAALCLLVVGMLLYGMGLGPPGGRSAAVGQAAPAMTMKTIDGETVRLEDLAGKVVVLNFWATWCPPCVAEIPDLARLAKEVNQEGGVVIGISDEDVDTIRSFVASRDMPYAIVAGSGWPAPFESIRAIPVTYFLDGAGTIREEFVGGRSYEVFRRAFDAAKAPLSPLADPAPAAAEVP